MQLHMIELHLEPTALLRFLSAQRLGISLADDDLGYGIHAWLKAAFSDLSPQPWRLLADRQRPPRVLAYGGNPADRLVAQMQRWADPQVLAVCPPDAIASKSLPAWRQGQRLGFELRCCPVGRKARSGREKDMFLIAADHRPHETLDRSEVYCDWARRQLSAGDATVVDQIRLDGFRLVHQTRKRKATPGEHRAASHPLRPEARISGTLTIGDPAAFGRLLARGIGRHRSFGHGMLLLRPESR